MPRNRRPRDWEEKRDEIVVAAAALFTEAGYDETSMAKVAERAGVTTTTIYWYFADKDALLVAVLDHVLTQATAAASGRGQEPWADQVLWAVDQLEQYHRLVTVVHARTSISPAIDDWHDGFHALMDRWVAAGLRGAGVPEDELTAMTRIIVFVVEGLLMHPLDAPGRRQIVSLLTASR